MERGGVGLAPAHQSAGVGKTRLDDIAVERYGATECVFGVGFVGDGREGGAELEPAVGIVRLEAQVGLEAGDAAGGIALHEKSEREGMQFVRVHACVGGGELR